jgi:hypothetical protein
MPEWVNIVALILSGLSFLAGAILVIFVEWGSPTRREWNGVKVATAVVAIVSLLAWIATLITYPW